MILTDREIQIALRQKQVLIDPVPDPDAYGLHQCRSYVRTDVRGLGGAERRSYQARRGRVQIHKLLEQPED
jgi:hypothetical protein